MLAGVGALVVAGAAAGLSQATAPGSSDDSTAAEAALMRAFATPWAEAVDVIGLKRQLVRAGYQVRVDATLGPVTKSALADYLRPGSASSLAPGLPGALRGTVLLGRLNPVLWNLRFGLNRPTKFVERPLTGPGGQLDADGNIRYLRSQSER
jgi:hypothetical protein